MVSKWSVKDHLEHLSIVNGRTVSWIERARDGDPKLNTGGRPSLPGRIVLLVEDVCALGTGPEVCLQRAMLLRSQFPIEII